MDKLEGYAQLIKEILTAESRFPPSHGNIEPLLIFDDHQYSYQLMYVGWDGMRRVHATIIHIRLRNGKVWIEYDGTAEGVATALLEAGIPQDEIVLGFHAIEKRPFTQFAVA